MGGRILKENGYRIFWSAKTITYPHSKPPKSGRLTEWCSCRE